MAFPQRGEITGTGQSEMRTMGNHSAQQLRGLSAEADGGRESRGL